MSLKATLLRDAVVLAIVLNAGAVLAQATDDARTLDAISVTSWIAIPGVEASSPVAAVERDEVLTIQPVAVEAFLKEFPALTPSIGQTSNYEPGGAATINMRELGDNRTLVLVDGRRPAPYNLANVVDTNTIPMALLQSVEMLTGGASVVYGADAVAGVTNFILRRDFEGVEVNTNWGQASKGDGTRQGYEVTFGALSDDGRANAVLSVGFSKADPMRQGDRPWSAVSLDSMDGSPGGSGSTVPARINVIGSGQDVRQIDPPTEELVDTYYWYNFNPLNYFQTGLDLGVRLAHDLPGALGGMQYALDLSKVTRDAFQAAPISIVRDCRGYYSTGCTPIPSCSYFDLGVSYNAPWNGKVSMS